MKKMDRSKAAKFQKMLRESEEFDQKYIRSGSNAHIYEHNELNSFN